jgi:hypothetical protein
LQKDWRLAWGEYIHEPDQRIAKIKDFPIADMILVMALVWLTIYVWTARITLLFGISIHFCIKFQHGLGEIQTPSSRSRQNKKSCSGAACSALIYD